MRKIIRVVDLCCKRCGDRVADKLTLLNGVTGAKANSKKNVLLVQHDQTVSDELLRQTVENEGFQVVAVEVRKGLFY